MGKGSGGSQVSGYRYYFDILMGICRGPVDQIVEIKVGDIEAWPARPDNLHPISDPQYLQGIFNPGAEGPPGGYYDDSGGPVATSARFSIAKPNLFGGDKGEGGIQGNCTVMMGDRNQIIPVDVKQSIANGTANHSYDYSPSSGIGQDTNSGDAGDNGVVERYGDISEFRGVCTIWYSGQVCSNNPYPKVWKVRAQRALAGWDTNGVWYPAKAIVFIQGGNVRAMNVAHIIYQTLTDRVWGRGMGRDELDEASFVYAANYFFDEGMGLCLKWNKAETITDFLQRVVNHANCVVQINRGTGLMEIRIIRDDYDHFNLPLFDYSTGLMKVENNDSTSNGVIPNEIIVKWHDPILDQDRQVRVQNLSSIQSTGATVQETKDYAGLGDAGLARKVALRDLMIYSASLKKLKLTMDRRAWKMQPGHVFRISAPDKGIISMIVRVVTYDDGTMLDGKITLECAQDVFATPTTQYSVEPRIDWVGPDSTIAAAPAFQVAYEASYYDMQHGLTPAQRTEVTSAEGGVIVIAGRPAANTLSGVLVAGTGGVNEIVGTSVFAPVGVTKNAMDYYTTDVQLATGTDLNQIQPGTSAIIGTSEIVRVDAFSVTTGIVTLARGCADTIPKLHAAGSKIYFHDTTRAGNTAAYAVGETVDVSLLSRTTRAITDPAAAATSSVTITGRWAKPYPPGNIRVNGARGMSVDGIFVSGDVTLSWASRNKVVEADQLVEHGAASVTPPEDTTTYTVQVWDHAAGTLLRSHAGLTGLTYVYTDDEADSNGDPIEVDLKLFTVVNGTVSMDTYSIYVVHVDNGAGGYGNAYGFYYGQPPV